MKDKKIWIWIAIIVVVVIVAVIVMNQGSKAESAVEEQIEEQAPATQEEDNQTVFEEDGANAAEAEEVEGTVQE